MNANTYAFLIITDHFHQLYRGALAADPNRKVKPCRVPGTITAGRYQALCMAHFDRSMYQGAPHG